MTLRQLREAKFLMQLELAEQVGVSPATISKWERGLSQPDLRRMRQLAAAFAVTPEEVKRAVEETAQQSSAEPHHTFWEEPGKAWQPDTGE